MVEADTGTAGSLPDGHSVHREDMSEAVQSALSASEQPLLRVTPNRRAIVEHLIFLAALVPGFAIVGVSGTIWLLADLHPVVPYLLGMMSAVVLIGEIAMYPLYASYELVATDRRLFLCRDLPVAGNCSAWEWGQIEGVGRGPTWTPWRDVSSLVIVGPTSEGSSWLQFQSGGNPDHIVAMQFVSDPDGTATQLSKIREEYWGGGGWGVS